jgi:prepilin-type N-terminal cleavage/methylation domain-containing protein
MHRSLSNRDRRAGPEGMTLIELLVVAAILAVLAGLLLPAVHAVRETGRRTGCAANQTRLALAFAAFDSRLGYLPGWRNRLQLAPGVKTAAGADHRLASWAVVLLPYIERTDVLNTMLANKMWADANPKEGILLTEYLCPSFKPKTQENAYSVLHYGVNVGTGANRNDGVLVDGTAASRMSLEDVREGDGLDQTMLVSEGAFDDKDWSWGPGWHFPMDRKSVFDNGRALLFGLKGGPVTKVINGPGSQHSLPRSKHVGGVNQTFCNGSVRFIKDSLPPHVYAHLVTSASVWSGSAYTPTNSAAANRWLRAPTAPSVAEEPFQLKQSDY